MQEVTVVEILEDVQATFNRKDTWCQKAEARTASGTTVMSDHPDAVRRVGFIVIAMEIIHIGLAQFGS